MARLYGPELLSLEVYVVFSSEGVKRAGLLAYFIPRKRSWLNSGRVRPMNIVLEVFVVERVAVGGFAVAPAINERRRVKKKDEVLDIGCILVFVVGWCMSWLGSSLLYTTLPAFIHICVPRYLAYEQWGKLFL
jgi:hypothetical protein